MIDITVITVCKNAERTIHDTLKCMVAIKDKHPNIEYVVVDGGSCDRTLEILNQYSNYIDYFKVIPDRGATSGFNNAFGLSNGENVMFLNADDTLPEDFFENLFSSKEWNDKSAEIFFGDLVLKTLSMKKYISLNAKSHLKLTYKMSLFFPSVVLRKSILSNPPFDETFQVAPDYNLLARLVKMGCKFSYVNGMYANLSMGGNSYRRYIRGAFECWRVSARIEGPIFRRVLQFVISLLGGFWLYLKLSVSR